MSALNIHKGASSHSAYDLRDPNAQVEEDVTAPTPADDDDPFNDPFFASDPEEAAKALTRARTTLRAAAASTVLAIRRGWM